MFGNNCQSDDTLRLHSLTHGKHTSRHLSPICPTTCAHFVDARPPAALPAPDTCTCYGMCVWYWLHNVCAQYKSQHSQMNADEQWTKYVKPRLLHTHTQYKYIFFATSCHPITHHKCVVIGGGGGFARLRRRRCVSSGMCDNFLGAVRSSSKYHHRSPLHHRQTSHPAPPVGVCARI